MDISIFHSLFFDIFVGIITLIFVGLTYIATVRSPGEQYATSLPGSVLVIVPCRGKDYSLEENLRSILVESSGMGKVIAVVDSDEDEALPLIQAAGMDYILSTDRCRSCSGKVKAIVTALDKFQDFDVFVIADSDITVPKGWLSGLVSPLSDPSYGISTTFPYFNPVGGIWSRIKLVWGFVGLGMMESRLTRFGWGGSLAFTRRLLENDGLHFLRTYVSDDVAITKLCKKRGLRIAYVKESAPKVNSPEHFSEFIEWANRQTALSIYATASVFRYGITFFSASIVVTLSAILLSIFVFPGFVILLTPSIITAIRNVKRARQTPLAVFIISIFIPFIYWYNLARARGMKQISWRGNSYLLHPKED